MPYAEGCPGCLPSIDSAICAATSAEKLAMGNSRPDSERSTSTPSTASGPSTPIWPTLTPS